MTGTRLHANCVAVQDRGLLILGPSGAGKSDLSLRLIDGGAMLVSDDYCDLEAVDGELFATAPETIRGKIEARGLGLINLPVYERARVALAILLERSAERLPEPETVSIEGVSLPLVRIDPAAPSAVARVRLALDHFGQSQ